MGYDMFLCALLVYVVMSGVSCRTIDETILSAQEHSPHREVPSHVVLVELDMEMGTDDYREMRRLDKETEPGEGQGRRMKRKAERDLAKRWTNNTIPYKITSGFSEGDKARIQAAVDVWNQYTCLNIRTYMSADDNYIRITDGNRCSAPVGMHKGSRSVKLAKGCRTKETVLHELGHVLGFWHEHSRPDRDRYIQIWEWNIKDGKEDNFERHPISDINSHGVPYDYLSIMHYGKTYFGVDGAQTIRTLDPKYQDLIGNSNSLSFNDVKLANLMYQCASHCSPKTCPGEGFVGKDCNCYCPGHRGNPTKPCGEGGGVTISGTTNVVTNTTPIPDKTTTEAAPTTASTESSTTTPTMTATMHTASTTTTMTPATTTPTTDTTTPTAAATTSRTKPGVSSADFMLVRGVCQYGGIVKAVHTESACLTQCALDPQCVAVDWRTASKSLNTRCRIHYRKHGTCEVNNPRRHKSTLCRHYRYTRTSRCDSGTV